MPTREDVLAIRSIDAAFDLWTTKVTRRELALIRVAANEKLIHLTDHGATEADEDRVAEDDVWLVVKRGKPASKDVDEKAGRQIGINFEGTIIDRRRIRVKVSWGLGYFIATVHAL